MPGWRIRSDSRFVSAEKENGYVKSVSQNLFAMRLVVACLVCGLAACFGTKREMPTPAELESEASQAQKQYVIGPLDVLAITVWRQPELSLPEITVRSDGKISFPLLDDVQAAGRTTLELKQAIAARIEEYVTAPHVTVVVRQINSKRVYILGEVAREGGIPLAAGMRVVDAIAIAGGFSNFAGKDRIKVIRESGDGRQTEATFDYDAFVKGRNLEQNILLLPGDRIIVPPESPFWIP